MTWKLTTIHYVAKMLGVLVHIEGLPYGSARNLKRELGVSGSVEHT